MQFDTVNEVSFTDLFTDLFTYSLTYSLTLLIQAVSMESVNKVFGNRCTVHLFSTIKPL